MGTTAFVFSGGACLGSIQVGMLLALEEEGIRPDFIIGTSVGAINGAWVASGQPARELGDIWQGMSRSDLFPLRPLIGLRGFLGRRNFFVPNRGLRHVLDTSLAFDRLEDAPIPLTVIATDARTGDEVSLQSGSAVEAILASSALPGIFPPIEIAGRVLVDGGVANNTPISRAVDAGATEVWVLSTGYSCALQEPPASALAMAMHAVAMLVQQRLVLETSSRSYPVPVRLIPPPCPITVPPTDFTQTKDLIERARAGTKQWLANGCPYAQPLDIHHHARST